MSRPVSSSKSSLASLGQHRESASPILPAPPSLISTLQIVLLFCLNLWGPYWSVVLSRGSGGGTCLILGLNEVGCL